MAIISSEIQYRLSGGASNAVANSSLGGAKSSTAITSGSANNLFDNVSGDEAAAGDIEYRCIYIHNSNASLTWENVKLWIETNTPSTSTTIDIGLGASAVGGTETAVANESTAPASVTFSAPTTKTGGLDIGNIPAGSHKAVWLRRTVTAGAAAVNNDNVVVRAEGDTAA